MPTVFSKCKLSWSVLSQVTSVSKVAPFDGNNNNVSISTAQNKLILVQTKHSKSLQKNEIKIKTVLCKRTSNREVHVPSTVLVLGTTKHRNVSRPKVSAVRHSCDRHAMCYLSKIAHCTYETNDS